jgi:hypothetical protein
MLGTACVAEADLQPAVSRAGSTIARMAFGRLSEAGRPVRLALLVASADATCAGGC